MLANDVVLFAANEGLMDGHPVGLVVLSTHLDLMLLGSSFTESLPALVHQGKGFLGFQLGLLHDGKAFVIEACMYEEVEVGALLVHQGGFIILLIGVHTPGCAAA